MASPGIPILKTTMSNNSLQLFIEKTMSIKPPPGWLARTSGSDAIYRLRKQAIRFAQNYQDKNVSKPELISCAQDLEGALLTLQVLSSSESQLADKLIGDLHNLMKSRT
jgi:hypothetical protein